MSAERRWTAEEIRYINAIRGPKTPEEANFYVEQGVFTPKAAAFWLENRRRLDDVFDRDIKRLIEAYRSRYRGKARIEETPEIRQLHAAALKLRSDNPRMTWPQVAANIYVPERTLYHWLERLGR